MSRDTAARQFQLEKSMALKDVLDTYQGRYVLWEIISACKVFGTTFAGEETHLAAFKEGDRHRGLQIYALVNEAGPEYLERMRVEHKQREDRRKTMEENGSDE